VALQAIRKAHDDEFPPQESSPEHDESEPSASAGASSSSKDLGAHRSGAAGASRSLEAPQAALSSSHTKKPAKSAFPNKAAASGKQEGKAHEPQSKHAAPGPAGMAKGKAAKKAADKKKPAEKKGKTPASKQSDKAVDFDALPAASAGGARAEGQTELAGGEQSGKQAQKETPKTGKAKAGQATVNQVCRRVYICVVAAVFQGLVCNRVGFIAQEKKPRAKPAAKKAGAQKETYVLANDDDDFVAPPPKKAAKPKAAAKEAVGGTATLNSLDGGKRAMEQPGDAEPGEMRQTPLKKPCLKKPASCD
jgi:hypothetical protein